MTLEEKKQEIIEEFSLYDEWLDKYEYLIELGKNLEPFPEDKKTEDRLIKGCQSGAFGSRPTATPSSPRASSRS